LVAMKPPLALVVPRHQQRIWVAATATRAEATLFAATRSFIPTSKVKTMIPPFTFYADLDSELQPKQQPPPPAMNTLEEYKRRLYSLSKSAEPGSANSAEPGSAKQAKLILRSMFVNCKQGKATFSLMAPATVGVCVDQLPTVLFMRPAFTVSK
jgi:hypothetical protein